MNEKDEENVQASGSIPEKSEPEKETLSEQEEIFAPEEKEVEKSVDEKAAEPEDIDKTTEVNVTEQEKVEETIEEEVVEEVAEPEEPVSAPEPPDEPKEEPAPVEEKPKEVIIIKEVEKQVPKEPNKFMKKVKRSILAVILIIAIVLAGSVYAWTSGMDDLRDDNSYLIVVVHLDVPKAATIYHKDTQQSEIVEVNELGALTSKKSYFENAQKKYGVMDRMIIIDMDTLKALSTENFIYYENGEKIYVDDMYDWLIGSKYPSLEIIGDDEPAIVKAKILKSWTDHYSDQLLGGYGKYTARVVLNAYRAGNIQIYPANSALFILKYVAVERIFFPV